MKKKGVVLKKVGSANMAFSIPTKVFLKIKKSLILNFSIRSVRELNSTHNHVLTLIWKSFNFATEIKQKFKKKLQKFLSNYKKQLQDLQDEPKIQLFFHNILNSNAKFFFLLNYNLHPTILLLDSHEFSMLFSKFFFEFLFNFRSKIERLPNQCKHMIMCRI